MRDHLNRRLGDRVRRSPLWLLVFAAVMAFGLGCLTGKGFNQAAAESDAGPVPLALPGGVSKFHDASEEVTCWTSSGSAQRPVALSCLPDQWLASARAPE